MQPELQKPGETKVALKSAIKDNEPILLDVIIDKDETFTDGAARVQLLMKWLVT